MKRLDANSIIAIVGSGSMGTGIAQVAATAGHKVLVFDNNQSAVEQSASSLSKILNRLVEKERITQAKAEEIFARITYCHNIQDLSESDLIIEAIVENLDIKKNLFEHLELIVEDDTILATNTS